jgi:uncharacterized protein YkwD
MLFRKIVTGILFLVIFVGGVFSFFYFSYGDLVLKNISSLLEGTSFYFENNNNSDDFTDVWSPGPLVKEDDGDGILTATGIIRETNKQRERLGREPLKENEKLNDIAQKKLDDMFEKQYFAHVSPEGEGVGDIARETTYEYLIIGDNLAMGGYRDDEEVVNAWMNSLGHRQNILEERYSEIGVAARKDSYAGRETWMAVQVFAMSSADCPSVDEILKLRIDEKNAQAEFLLQERERVEREIDNIERRGSEEHIAKVEEYNSLGKKYNDVVRSLDKLIEDYNEQVRRKDDCIRGHSN